MSIGSLASRPLSVAEVVTRPELDGQYVAVHGVLYLGAGWLDEGFVCLPKEGPFDGINQDVRMMTSDRHAVVRVCEPDLQERLRAGSIPMLTGAATYNLDAIIVGRVQRRGNDPVCITDLWMMILQIGAVPELHMRLTVCVVCFGDNRLPQLPWDSPVGQPGGGSDLELTPLVADEP